MSTGRQTLDFVVFPVSSLLCAPREEKDHKMSKLLWDNSLCPVTDLNLVV